MTSKRISSFLASAFALGFSAASAQTPATAPDAGGHAQHQRSTSPARAQTSAPPPAAGTESTEGMDHGEMNSQGGPPPPDARDPHGYSEGYRRNVGKYALPPAHRLQFADEHNFSSLLVNRLERVGGESTAYEAQAWFGRTYDKLVVKAEGDWPGGEPEKTELLWGHAIANYWDTQLGVRYETGTGPDRTWLAFGFQGLAPYWFELDVTAGLGSNGRATLTVEGDYELLLTQRLILQPRVEVNIHSKPDLEREIGRGVSEVSAGLRLRYEITRQFAPYIGVEWTSKFGQTADIARAANEQTDDTRFIAGVRFWF